MLKSFYKWFLLLLVIACCPVLSQETRDTILPYEIAYNRAQQLVDSAKYKESLTELKKAIKLKPDYWEAYNLSAITKIRLLDYKEAAKDLEKSDKIMAGNFETLKWEAINFYFLNKFPESKKLIDSAVDISIEEKIDDAELFYYRALLMFKGKSYKPALEACETALDYKPNYMEVFLLKGEIRFAKKEYNYAIRELTEAIKLMPETKPVYSAYKLRAKSRFEAGDFKGAITDWDVYMEAFPSEEEALVSRAAAKININDNSGAISDLDQAIKINGKNAVSYCYRGVAKGGNKQYVEAIKDLDYSIKLKFDYAAAYVNRAAIKMASKDKRGACADLEKADGLGDEMAVKLIEKYCKDTRE